VTDEEVEDLCKVMLRRPGWTIANNLQGAAATRTDAGLAVRSWKTSSYRARVSCVMVSGCA
jgi:hypothetical protein